jgi:hypothetical protein
VSASHAVDMTSGCPAFFLTIRCDPSGPASQPVGSTAVLASVLALLYAAGWKQG